MARDGEFVLGNRSSWEEPDPAGDCAPTIAEGDGSYFGRGDGSDEEGSPETGPPPGLEVNLENPMDVMPPSDGEQKLMMNFDEFNQTEEHFDGEGLFQVDELVAEVLDEIQSMVREYRA